MPADHDIVAALEKLPEWRREGDALTRTVAIDGGMADAVAFAARLVAEADRANHHPDIAISWNRVTITWTTHDAGGITARDIEMAATTDRLIDRG